MFLSQLQRRIISIIIPAWMICTNGNGEPEINTNNLFDPPGKKTFILIATARNIEDFRKLVGYASVLKPYGRVQINISSLADKSFYQVPKQRSPWFEYASYNPGPCKFYPGPELAPFIPADFVNRNRQLILAKGKVLRENNMDGVFFGSEPEFLPDVFFDKYPDLLGPRVDHPRRSNNKAFAPCISMKKTQDMYSGMIASLLKEVPEIKTFYFKTNDAGAGLCWSEWLYSGPNGPQYCKNKTTGERVQDLMNTFRAGASKAGKEIDVYLSEPQGSSNFSEDERNDIQNRLPPHSYFKSTKDNEIIRIGSDIAALYPVVNIADPVSFLNSVKQVNPSANQTIFINFRSFYDRGNESGEVEELFLNILENQLRNPGANNQESLKLLSEKWAGKTHADELYQAFMNLNEAFRFRNSYLNHLYAINWNVGARLISRPLVAAPQRLSKEEEAYFLPHIFNVSEEEARMDYTDIQGGRWTASTDTINIYAAKIENVAAQFEAIGNDAPKAVFIHTMSIALRIHASLLKSCGNFVAAQQVRDRNAEKLNGAAHRPDKAADFTGDADLQRFNTIMRSELDNTQSLIDLLQQGGIRSLCLAPDKAHEDCFLLGPDLVAQLKKKRKIMLDHWTDIQDYLTTPFK